MSGERPCLAERIRAGERLLGLVVKIPGPAVLEIAGHSGYDLVVIDTEHGPADTEALEHHLRAADGAGVPALVRVGGIDPCEILRALDAGAEGIVVPRVDTAAQAAAAVAAAHYPPHGRRGLATSTRAGRHGLVGLAEHVRRARERTLVVVQVEDAEALPHVAAIAAEPGVDGVFLGPTDLSMSLGQPGDLAHPLVADAIEQVAAQVREASRAPLCTLVGDEHEAQRWYARGAQIVLLAAPPLIAKRLYELARAVRDGRATTDGEAVLKEVRG